MSQKLNTEIKRLPLQDLQRQELNARFMRGETFRTLVDNLRKDGVLTSAPTVNKLADGRYKILSGHHRVAAAIEAGLLETDCVVVLDELTRSQELALVLSHNSLSGEDDPSTLRAMWDEIDDADWRWYSGLDDKVMATLDDVSTAGLSEANLDFSTINLVFLPHELEAAEEAFEEAKKRSGVLKSWLAGVDQYEPALEALEMAQGSYSVGNVATALGIILEVFSRHVEDLQEGWVDEAGEAVRAKKPVPMATVFGSANVPGERAATILKAVRVARKAGDITKEGSPWDLMELLAQTYLMSAEFSE